MLHPALDLLLHHADAEIVWYGAVSAMTTQWPCQFHFEGNISNYFAVSVRGGGLRVCQCKSHGME
jgi:hypothetical protein